MIPEWMKEVDTTPCPRGPAAGGKRNFIGKTLSGIFNFLEETIVSEGYARRNGLLQSLDPRIKLISIVALIVAMTLVTDWRLMLFVYGLTLLFAVLSGIGAWFFIKRVWLFIPIFTGIIAMPMIFNVFFPGDSWITLVTPGPGAKLGPLSLPETIAITRQGTLGAIAFTLRVAVCVSAAVLLFLTTPRDRLFKALRSIGVPKVYVLTLDMCYRYIFLLTDMVKAFYTAKKSRTIKSLPLLEEQRWVGGRVGFTLVRSLDMAEKVHGAMVSRGFNGDIRILEDFALRPRDYVAAASVLGFSLLLILHSYQIIRL